MSVLEPIGSGVIQRLAYIGGLTNQFCSSLVAFPRLLPFVGRHGRWQSAIRQMCAIGVGAVPMVASWRPAADLSSRSRVLLN